MSALALPHGLHRDVPEVAYHARERGLASKSALDLVLRSLAHYKAWLDGASEPPTPAMRFGSSAHCALLEPDRWRTSHVVANPRTKASEAGIAAGKHVVTADELITLTDMREALMAHELARGILVGGPKETELTMRWRDPETGVECKGRVDLYRPDLGMIVDYKTTADASPEAFARSIGQYGYHRQRAFYESAFAALGNPVDSFEGFVFIAQEKTAPYAVALYHIDDDAASIGHAANVRALRSLADACAKDEWPSYPPKIRTLSLKPWVTE